jgi:hypothetical protein
LCRRTLRQIPLKKPKKSMAIVADSAETLRAREESYWRGSPPQTRGCWRDHPATVMIHSRHVSVHVTIVTQVPPAELSIERLTPTMTHGADSPVSCQLFGRDNVTHIPFLTLRQHFRPICASWIPCPLELPLP